MAND
jgi:serine/threonine-protein phosphatase 2A regulatory subunit A